MKNHEIIDENEWYNRLITEKVYIVVNIDYNKGTTRVFENETSKMYDVVMVNVGKKKMLKVIEVE